MAGEKADPAVERQYSWPPDAAEHKEFLGLLRSLRSEVGELRSKVEVLVWLGERLFVREALDVPTLEPDAAGVLPPLTFKFRFGRVRPGAHVMTVVVRSLAPLPRFAAQVQPPNAPMLPNVPRTRGSRARPRSRRSVDRREGLLLCSAEAAEASRSVAEPINVETRETAEDLSSAMVPLFLISRPDEGA